MSEPKKTPPALDPALIDWVEKLGLENLKARLATGDMLLTQANQLLTILLAGMGGSLAYGTRVLTPTAGMIEWGAAITSLWLAAIAGTLAHRCIATRETQVQYNEPGNMYRPDLGHSLPEVKVFENTNIQTRIESTKRRNSTVAYWLDRCRYATAATPIIFALAAAATYFFTTP